jgi:hypothetical protein
MHELPAKTSSTYGETMDIFISFDVAIHSREAQGQEQINFVRADKVHVIEEIGGRTKEEYNTILEVRYSKGPRSSLTIYNKLSKYIVYIGF